MQKSKGRYDACNSLFRERVLPKFPIANERFSRHFKDSFELIQNLPTFTNRGVVHYHPLFKKMKREDLTVTTFPIEVALCSLGLKPLASYGGFASALIGMKSQIENAGLRMTICPSGVEIFEPVGASRLLTEILNRKIAVENLEEAFKEVSPSHVWKLLGYTNGLKDGDLSQLHFRLGSKGYLEFPSLYYMSHLGWRIYSEYSVGTMMEDRAATVAIVEEIRGTPASLISEAVIRSYQKETSSVSIRRNPNQLGDWTIERKDSL